MAKRLPCKDCGMLTKHYDSRGGVSLICSECGTVAPVYRVNRPAPVQDQGTDLFAMQTGETREMKIQLALDGIEYAAAMRAEQSGLGVSEWEAFLLPDQRQTLIDAGRLPGKRALYRKGDPATSKEAAARVTPILNDLEAAVDAAVFVAGERGATAAEVHEATGIDLQSLTPRFKPLERKGRIVRTSERRGGRYVWIAAEWAQARAA